MPRQAPCALAVLVALCACVPRVTFYSPHAGACPKRPKGCSFELISKRPARDYAAIGVIDLEALSVRKLPNDDASFRAAIADQVCEAGGDAVVPGVNGDGRYVLATVVKWVDADTSAPVCPKASLPAGAADAGAETKHGAVGAAAAESAVDASLRAALTRDELRNRAGASW